MPGRLGGSIDITVFEENLWDGRQSGKYLGMVNTRQLSTIFTVYYLRDYPLRRFTHTADK